MQGVFDALALLDLEDCIVTAVALHCRKDMAAIRRAGGDFALGIKADQPLLLAEAERRLAGGKGEFSIVKAPDLKETSGFPGACALARVDAVRQTVDGI